MRNTTMTPEDIAVCHKRVARFPMALELYYAALQTEIADSAIMVARTVARSGRMDGYAESCKDYLTKRGIEL